MALVIYGLILLFCIHKSNCVKVKINSTFLRCGEGAPDKLDDDEDLEHSLLKCYRKLKIIVKTATEGEEKSEDDYISVNHLFDTETQQIAKLLYPLVVKIKQEQVTIAYPFHYLTSVLAKASESIYNKDKNKNYTGCNEDSIIRNYCGYHFLNGEKIEHSEGFCCYCDDPAFETHPRGGQKCKAPENITDPEVIKDLLSSAHCLTLHQVRYAVSSFEHPVLRNNAYIQIFLRKTFPNGTKHWVELTEGKPALIGAETNYYVNEIKDGVHMHFIKKGELLDSHIKIPFKTHRALIPLPMRSIEDDMKFPQISNGGKDYLISAIENIDSSGKKCDLAGVSYQAFYEQPNRCGVAANTCLSNQPLDWWEEDTAKAGASTTYVLSTFGKVHKSPISVKKKTKEHWLLMNFLDPSEAKIIMEVDASHMVILRPGYNVQITSVMSYNSDGKVAFEAEITNMALLGSEFKVSVHACTEGIPDSAPKTQSITPQNTLNFKMESTYTGEQEAKCEIIVTNHNDIVVAKRPIIIQPTYRCYCYYHCHCTCLDRSLKCVPMSLEEFHLAGFHGSLPIKHVVVKPFRIPFPLNYILIILFFLLLMGSIKMTVGHFNERIGNYYLDLLIQRKTILDEYYEPELKMQNVIYDVDGYPIHPTNHTRVRVVGKGSVALLNLFFFIIYPFVFFNHWYKERKLKKKGNEDQNPKGADTSKKGRGADTSKIERGAKEDKNAKNAQKNKNEKIEGKRTKEVGRDRNAKNKQEETETETDDGESDSDRELLSGNYDRLKAKRKRKGQANTWKGEGKKPKPKPRKR